ncbi:ABC transporter permease [uncultured Litoreibacter sp.]|uniref:ABC transporter permease n=1 Tax=uncultured Litoreibacter sp. TaxID=1392394 RepID=UPI002605DB24|nr:ABC transporter permease [uncultured Litoreibacter sp.]
MTLIYLILILIALVGVAWVFRAAGQQLTENKPFFRDMPLGVAYGYVFAVVALAASIWYYSQPIATATEPPAPVPGVIFFRWAVQGFLAFGIAAYLFKLLGENFGSEASKKLFRSMPLTASFGVMIILTYAFVSIFAGQISILTVAGVGAFGVFINVMIRRNSSTDVQKFSALLTLVTVAVFALMYVLGPLAPYGQEEVLGAANIVPGGNPAVGGNPEYPLGTDQIGRDILSRLIFGAQNTVGIAFVTTCLAFFIGGSLGFLAATLGGWLDQLLSRAVDALMAIPALIFALLLITIATAWAGSASWQVTIYMIFIIAVIDSTRVFRLSRAVGLNIVVMDYIEAAKLRGEGLGYLVFREMLPNAYAPLLAEFGLRFCFVFLTIASLSFLGVGIQPPLADWGTMVRDLSQFINFAAFAPNVAVAPLLAAGAIALLTVAVNFVVDWMLHKSSGLKE